MAYVDGPSLQKEMESGPLSIDRALELAIQMAEGLQTAHEKGTVHRDIKTANIMLTSKGQVKITDFGLAKLPGRTRLTKTGSTVGTVAYMSPEQARGEAVDHRTDIWSLGVVLYEMVTGRVPFRSEYEQAVVYSIMNEMPEPMTGLRTGVPLELERIVGKAMEKDAGRRYQRVEEMLVDLRNLKDKGKPGVQIAGRVPRRSRRRIMGYGLAVLAAATVLLVGLKIRIGREPPAQAAENKLAVMYFENMAEPGDPGRLGEIVTNLLITDLSESHYLQVVSSQRLYDILKLLGREGVKVVDRDLATQVAGKAKAKWMLLGSILQEEPELIVTSQLVEVASGNAVASQKITGEAGEKVFSLVDKLTVEVKNDLSLPTAAKKESDRPIAEVTTNSTEAYRYYIEGADYEQRVLFPEAKRSFEKALEYDSTLAMAYYQLCWIQMGTAGMYRLIDKAVAHSHKASEKERLYIMARHADIDGDPDRSINLLHEILKRYPDEKIAHRELGIIYDSEKDDQEKALYHYTKAIELDPSFHRVYNDLAYIYEDIGNFEKAIWAIQRYISLTPNDPNPYDTQAEIYALNGMLDQAIESYEQALKMKSDFESSLRGLGIMHLFKRNYAMAESTFLILCSSNESEIRAEGRYHLALIPACQGKFVEALNVLNTGIAADSMEHARGAFHCMKYHLEWILYKARREWDEAKKIGRLYCRLCPETAYRDMYILYFDAIISAESGSIAEAEEKAAKLEKHILDKHSEDKKFGVDWMNFSWNVKGNIELAKSNPGVAAEHFERETTFYNLPSLESRFNLAGARLAAGNSGEAVDILERMLKRYNHGRARDPVRAAKAYYLLGLAYEQSGWTAKAIEQYKEFLDIWKDADPGLKEVADARERLKRLRGFK
ncbi:MAG: protein kinase [Chitinivibrionia bacterium]|nr:protein kinase [Chitinivibrionia bacterium]